jgi:hypothetical protein
MGSLQAFADSKLWYNLLMTKFDKFGKIGLSGLGFRGIQF